MAKKYTQDERTAQVVKMLRKAEDEGRELETKEVKRALGVTLPTALADMRRARDILLTDTKALAVIVENGDRHVDEANGLAPGQRIAPGTAIMMGVNMGKELFDSAQKLKRIADDLERDVSHARYFILGCPTGEKDHPYPGLCPRCGVKEVERITVRNQPRLLNVGYSDIASLFGVAVRAQTSLTKIVDTQTKVLNQYYSYDQLDKFISDVRAAVAEVCPEHKKELAEAIRRRQAKSGGVHGL